ncbi:MAG: hypothetical protein IPK08_19850 [Bacteroidetes bacterium]|nr:hypothetical protein [Bacteroidota bacterium]
MVNKYHIQELHNGHFVLKNGFEIPVSRRNKVKRKGGFCNGQRLTFTPQTSPIMSATLEQMLLACQFQSEMSKRVFDDKLMYYAAQREKFDPFFKTIDKRYGHVVENIRPEYWRLLKGEFIAARIFQKMV